MSLDVFDTVLSFASVMLVLSLFVTAWVQLLGGFLRLRHRNLRWGLERLLNQLDPENKLAGQARAVARRIASEVPALATDSTLFGGGTEALKPAELVNTLRALAAANDSGAVGRAVTALVGSIDTASAPAALGSNIAAISSELVTLFPTQAKAVQEAVQEAVDRGVKRGDALARQVGDWFDTVMDRVADLDVLRDVADAIERTRRHALVDYYLRSFDGRIPGVTIDRRLDTFRKVCELAPESVKPTPL